MQKPVAVETYSMEAYEIWPEEDLLVIYGMMDSVNSVIQAIVSDANFAESTPGM